MGLSFTAFCPSGLQSKSTQHDFVVVFYKRFVELPRARATTLSCMMPISCTTDHSVVMALVTYILLAALYSGLQSRFHPEILGITASKALAVVLLDFIFVKLGCYFLNIQVSSACRVHLPRVVLSNGRAGCQIRCWTCWRTTDTSSSGACLDPAPSARALRPRSVILTLIAGLLNLGRTLYTLVFLYAFLATAFFLVCLLPTLLRAPLTCPQLRSLRYMVLPDAAATAAPVNPAQRSRRITFLFLVAVTQIVYMGILVRV